MEKLTQKVMLHLRPTVPIFNGTLGLRCIGSRRATTQSFCDLVQGERRVEVKAAKLSQSHSKGHWLHMQFACGAIVAPIPVTSANLLHGVMLLLSAGFGPLPAACLFSQQGWSFDLTVIWVQRLVLFKALHCSRPQSLRGATAVRDLFALCANRCFPTCALLRRHLV